MMCYRDMTFCSEQRCKFFGAGCGRSLTQQVIKDAERWWGRPGAPIARYGSQPECYEFESPKKEVTCAKSS